jgi:hypothetical protein
MDRFAFHSDAVWQNALTAFRYWRSTVFHRVLGTLTETGR